MHGTTHQISLMIPAFSRRLFLSGTLPASLEAWCRTLPVIMRQYKNRDSISVETNNEEMFDCIVCSLIDTDYARLESILEQCNKILHLNGRVVLVFSEKDTLNMLETQHAGTILKDWIIYHEGCVTPEKDVLPFRAITFVKVTYNPVLHAKNVAEHGRPDNSILILNGIPATLIATEETEALLAMEKQRYYLQWQQMLTGKMPPHSLFSKSSREFAQVTAIRPDIAESYRLHASFWSHVGRNDMAIRTLRSIYHFSHDFRTCQMLQQLDSIPHNKDKSATEMFPSVNWQEGCYIPRILLITHDHSDYGMNTLYHGLCNLLGKENVVEYPFKPTLHGGDKASAEGYPCVFDYPGIPETVDGLVLQLQAGCFDFIVHTDVIKLEHREQVRRLANAVPDIPLVLYDTWDDCYTPMDLVLEYIGRSKFDLIFKREMLSGIDYGKYTYPLPFSYQENLAVSDPQFNDRLNSEPFWIGKREYGLRPLYIRSLEKMVGHSLDGRIDQNLYHQKLRSSLVGLCFFGTGFDTVRYWELPANGVMLLAERPPIIIPDNFEDCVSAVFFDDLPDMEKKLAYYLDHRDEATRIALNGHKHFLKYHTTTARARRFLGTIFKYLPCSHN